MGKNTPPVDSIERIYRRYLLFLSALPDMRLQRDILNVSVYVSIVNVEQICDADKNV